MKANTSGKAASKTTLLGALAVIAIIMMTSATTTQAAEHNGGKTGNAQTSAVIGSTNNTQQNAFEFNAKTEAVGIGVIMAKKHTGVKIWTYNVGNRIGGDSVAFTNGVGFGNQVGVNTANNNGATYTKTDALGEKSNVVTVGNFGLTTNTHTAADAAQYGTIEGGLQHANEVFGGTVQGFSTSA